MSSSSMASMLKIEQHSSILEEAMGSRLLEGKREACELSISDFDDCQFKLVVQPGAEAVMTLHIHVPCYDTLKTYFQTTLDEVYAGMATEPETGFLLALKVDCDAAEDKEATLRKLVFVKRNLLGAPLTAALQALQDGTAKDFAPVEVHWRKTESMFLSTGPDPANPSSNYDRVTVIFSVDFPEEADRCYCRNFLQQLQDVQRKVNNAPPITFSEPFAPPLEIRDKVNDKAELVGYISFTLFITHCKTPERLEKTVNMLVGFRNYLHFHIKAAKTNLHMRMRYVLFAFCLTSRRRSKVNHWKQVLNRAIQTSQEKKEMKTSKGKTFTRK